MKIFVVNCGSSSIKYELFEMPPERSLAEGLLARVGGDAELTHRTADDSRTRKVSAKDHREGMRHVLEELTGGDSPVLENPEEIDAVGHRVVHCGPEMIDAAVVEDNVVEVIRRGAELAPLHNPRNLAGIEAARDALPEATHVAVFDTGFFATLPEHAFRYAVPESWYDEHHVRKYGFHGLSHQYVAGRAAKLLDRRADETDLITVHLGNGCSVTAIHNGQAVDHSMGMTPMEGLMMGTRSGDIDPGVLLYMLRRGLSVDEIDDALNYRSGLLGVGGAGSDMRDVLAAVAQDDSKAKLAVDMFVHRIVKYIGGYYAILPEVNAVVLTGGIGENAREIRRRIVHGLARLGAVLDENRNEATVAGNAGAVTTDASALAVWVVPTDEELMIARRTNQVILQS